MCPPVLGARKNGSSTKPRWAICQRNSDRPTRRGESDPCPSAKNPRKTACSAKRAAPGAAQSAPGSVLSSRSCTNPPPYRDPDLQLLIKAWSTLPEAIRAGIKAMIQAAGKEVR